MVDLRRRPSEDSVSLMRAEREERREDKVASALVVEGGSGTLEGEGAGAFALALPGACTRQHTKAEMIGI
jgi:hypothetical protein